MPIACKSLSKSFQLWGIWALIHRTFNHGAVWGSLAVHSIDIELVRLRQGVRCCLNCQHQVHRFHSQRLLNKNTKVGKQNTTVAHKQPLVHPGNLPPVGLLLRPGRKKQRPNHPEAELRDEFKDPLISSKENSWPTGMRKI